MIYGDNAGGWIQLQRTKRIASGGAINDRHSIDCVTGLEPTCIWSVGKAEIFGQAGTFDQRRMLRERRLHKSTEFPMTSQRRYRKLVNELNGRLSKTDPGDGTHPRRRWRRYRRLHVRRPDEPPLCTQGHRRHTTSNSLRVIGFQSPTPGLAVLSTEPHAAPLPGIFHSDSSGMEGK
jgi:hypothetical protein